MCSTILIILCPYEVICGRDNSTIFDYLVAERSSGEQVMSSFESKKVVHCGLCNYSARRDVMKTRHFPMTHRGKLYIEKGEQQISFKDFQKNVGTSNAQLPALPELPPREAIGDVDNIEKVDTAKENINIEERGAYSISVEATQSKETVSNINPEDKQDLILEEIMKLQKLMINQQKTNLDAGMSNVSNVKEKLVLIQSSKSTEELSMRAGLTMFESQNKLVCDICTHDDLSNDDSVKKLGEFQYDQFSLGDDFRTKSEPREFRNLKTSVVRHFTSPNHLKMSHELSEKHKEDEKNGIYNEVVGMGRARVIYENVKNKCSFAKYESDCLVSALNGEDVGNINHSWMFAEEVVKEVAVTIQTDLKTHFRTPLACTGQLPPVGLATDKMTQKRHTNHLAAFLTPDVDAPLSESFLKPVFADMPVVDKHGGREIAEQMLQIAECYLVDLSEQLQAFNNDGQYFGLNVKKHIFELRKDLIKRKDFILFNWDPSHRNALADKDARKEQKEEKSYFNEVLETVQWTFRNIGYGKHFEEYLAICEELNINPRAPILFSDTRFPQFSYNTLRNFLQVYVGLLHQLEAEDTLKKK